MSFQRPTLKELIERLNADAQSRLNTTQLRRSNARVYARVMAAASHELHSHIEYMAKQMFFDTAESEYLDRWGSIYGLYRKPAAKASGEVTFSFSGDPVEIPEGTLLQSGTGQQYETIGSVEGGKAKAQALMAGAAGNLDAGEEMSLISPIAGVYSQVTAGEFGGGVDVEDDESLRTRLLARVQEPPKAGTASDYEAWTLEVEGITRAWVYPKEDGNGTITIRCVSDNLDDIRPSNELLERVKEHLDNVRPVTAIVKVEAPSLQPVNITISNLDPSNESVKARIRDELKDMFTREAIPGGRIYLSHIRAAISMAAGENDHTVVAPTEDVVPSTGVLLTFGEITWQ